MGRDWKEAISDPDERKVFDALDSKDWDFRTVEGLEKSTGLSRLRIEEILAKHPDLVKNSPIKDKIGRRLFTLMVRGLPKETILAILRSAATKSS